MSYNYTQFVSTVANRMAISSTGPAFQIELPNIIDAAEQRIYRELDLADTRVIDLTGTLTPNTRGFTLPSSQGTFVVVEQVNVITPVGAITPASVRNPLTPVSRDSIDALWPTTGNISTPSIPEFFAMITSQVIRVGPAPDAAYPMEIQGTVRPTPLSATNPTTLLSQNLPDLFLAASMVIAAGYQKNFGAQADDPKMAMSWETVYQAAKVSAVTEEFRKRYNGSAWSPMASPPEAQPPRN